MKRTAPSAAWVLVLLLGGSAFGDGPAPEAPPATPLTGRLLLVCLRPAVRPQGACVRLKDVATFRGGTPDLTEQAAALDLADVPPAGKTTVLSKEAIAFRLQLAGIDRRAFHLEGADRVVVGFTEQRLTEADLVNTARKQLLQHLPWPAEDVRIQVTQPPPVPALEFGPDDQVSLEAELRSSGSMVGRVVVDITVLVNGRECARVPVGLEIKLHQQLAVASRRIEAGEVLTKENLRPDRRLLEGGQQAITYAECVSGRRAKRALPAGQLLTRGDVESGEEAKLLVKQRDLVKLLARVGAMRVEALGEALQDGSAGQFIRVKNVDSKNVILGRVVDRALVEVTY